MSVWPRHNAGEEPEPLDTTRIAIIFDVHARRDYAHQWAHARVAQLDRDLRRRVIAGRLVRIDIDGSPHPNP